MNEINWQTAKNLKDMLREGKTFLEIINKVNSEKKIDRCKTAIEVFIKEITISEIYHHIIEMEPVDQENYNKIMTSLIKRFQGPYITVNFTIPQKTIEKFHVNFINENKNYSLFFLITVCVTLIAVIYFFYFITKLQ